MSYELCPCCNTPVSDKTQDKGYKVDGRKISGAIECPECSAVFGQVLLGDSYAMVLPYFHPNPDTDSEVYYYDFITLSSRGLDRRHGWFDPYSRLIVQVG